MSRSNHDMGQLVAAEEPRCPTCGGRVKIDRVRQELDPPFVQPGGPIVRRATCEAGHVTWADDES